MGEDRFLRMVHNTRVEAGKIKLIAVIVIILAALVCFLFLPQAHAEQSHSIESLYRIESEAMRLSEAPVRVTIIDLAVVDIDADALRTGSEIVATVYFPLVPDDCIEGVVLFDGWHLASAQWQRTAEKALMITFRVSDLAQFDGTVGLYLILVGHAE